MKKIFTLGCGLLLMSAFAFNEAKADYLPQSTWIYFENYDEEEIADPVKEELIINSEGEYTITNFLNSKCPFAFTFEKTAIDETSAITITSNHSSSKTSPYLLDENDDYLYCWLENLNGEEGWFMVYAPKIYITEDYSFVYHLNKEEYGYDYYVNLTFKGTVYAEDDTEYENPIELGWSNLYFYFNEPEEAAAQDMPEYPEKLDFTLNGQEELPGVIVTQTMEPFEGNDYLTITLTGECDSDEITLDITTPEGWDGMLVRSDYTGESGEIEPLKAKAPAKDDEDLWMPTSMAMYYGVTEGNSITFPADGKEWGGMAFLVKGEEAYMVNIDFVSDVKKSDEPIVEAPELPDHLDYTLNGEKELPGVNVRQLIDESTHVFSIKGECEADEITVAFDIPEGWDGMMIADTFGEGEISTVKTRGTELIPVKDILGQGFLEGNAITYATNGEAQWGMIALIKGDMACPTFIDYDFTVSKNGGSDVPGPSEDDPAFPDSLVITTFPEEGLEVWQGEDQEVYTIGISGEISEPSFTVVIDVPEGWDGFISIPYEDNIVIGESGFNPKKTRAEEYYYWEDIDEVLSWGAIKGNRFTFTPNGEEQDVAIYLYKGDQVEMVNWISLETMVSVNLGSGVNWVNAAEKATYYDLQGNRIAKPAKGMYVKVADGKATKVVVK